MSGSKILWGQLIVVFTIVLITAWSATESLQSEQGPGRVSKDKSLGIRSVVLSKSGKPSGNSEMMVRSTSSKRNAYAFRPVRTRVV